MKTANPDDDQNAKHRLMLGILEFCQSSNKYTFRAMYWKIIAKYYCDGYEICNGTAVPIILPKGQRPTFSQFRYACEKLKLSRNTKK